jgi:hypothetical protein
MNDNHVNTPIPVSARQALTVARELTEPGEPNGEYIRGQAELICDLFGLPVDEYRDAFIAEIVKGMKLPETVKAADGKTDLHRFNVTGVVYARDRAEAQRRLSGTYTLLDHAEIADDDEYGGPVTVMDDAVQRGLSPVARQPHRFEKPGEILCRRCGAYRDGFYHRGQGF